MIDLWIKAFLRYPQNIGRARQLLSSKRSSGRPPLTGSAVVLDLRTPQLLFDSGRHLACFAHNASLAGSPTFLRCSRLLLAEVSRKQFGEELLTDPNVTWLPPGAAVPADSLVLYDAPNVSPDLSADSLAVRMMIGRDVIAGTPVMPYPMHPATISMLDQVDLGTLRSSSRQIQLLFAGTQTPRYGYPRVERDFGVRSRLSLLETVRRHRSDRINQTIADATSRNAIVLVDSQTHSIKCSDWLPALAASEFFLCCPGAAQPMCHNVIEAMSVGTIPLLEYGDRLTPPLTDGVNAIGFRGLNGLQDALDRIDRLTPAELTAMRENVIQYYETYLRGDRFLADVRDGKTPADQGMISMPFNDKNLFRKKVATAFTEAA